MHSSCQAVKNQPVMRAGVNLGRGRRGHRYLPARLLFPRPGCDGPTASHRAGSVDALASDLLQHGHQSQRVSPQRRFTPADFTRHTIVLPRASETVIESLG